MPNEHHNPPLGQQETHDVSHTEQIPLDRLETGKIRDLSKVTISARDILKRNWDEATVKRVLLAEMKHHAYSIGFTFDEGEERYAQEPNGAWSIYVFLRPSLVSPLARRESVKRFPVPRVSDLFRMMGKKPNRPH